MKTNIFIILFVSVCMVGCHKDNDILQDGGEPVFTVSQGLTTKGKTSIISGLGTYKTGQTVKLKAKSGATISGRLLRGQGSFGYTYESNGYAWADIQNIHGDWEVTATIPDYTVTVKSDGNGEVKGDCTVEKGNSASISASPSSGYKFSKWVLTSGSGSFANASSASTTFKPDKNSVVTATFAKNELKTVNVFITISISSTDQGLQLTATHNCDSSLPPISLYIEQWVVQSGLATQRNVTMTVSGKTSRYLIPNTKGCNTSNGACYKVSPSTHETETNRYNISASSSW